MLAFGMRKHVCIKHYRDRAIGRAYSLHRRQPQTALALHQEAGSVDFHLEVSRFSE